MQSRLKSKPFTLVFGLALAILILPLIFNIRTKAADKKVASPYTQQSFIKEVAPLAQDLSDSYGIKASVIIAQAAEASDYGRNLLAYKYHNYMGLVANPGQAKVVLTTQVYQSGHWQTQKKSYGIYRNWKDSLYAYAEAVSSGTWGKELYTTLATAEDYQTALQALEKSGFSTDPNYAQKLSQIIQANNLVKYDKS